MIDAVELVKNLAQSQIIQNELPLEMQLGLPYLEKRNGKIIIRFFPHQEVYDEEKVLIYPRKYDIAWVYPFAHLAFFRNLAFDGTEKIEKETSIPLLTISSRRMLSVGKYGMKELFHSCGNLLNLLDENGVVADAIVSRYQNQFFDLVDTLRLRELYGKMKSEDSC